VARVERPKINFSERFVHDLYVGIGIKFGGRPTFSPTQQPHLISPNVTHDDLYYTCSPPARLKVQHQRQKHGPLLEKKGSRIAVAGLLAAGFSGAYKTNDKMRKMVLSSCEIRVVGQRSIESTHGIEKTCPSGCNRAESCWPTIRQHNIGMISIR
jgi:hypothetical protein